VSNLRKYILLLIIAFTSVVSYSTHIAGGEITYEYVSQNRYKIRLHLYIDCENGSNVAILQDTTANIGFFNAKTNSLIKVVNIARKGPTRIKELHYNCVSFNSNACVDEYVYEFEESLVPSDHGIVISFQRCCRNRTISNLVNPESVGATYTVTIPPTTNVAINSAPSFNKLPPNFLCINAPLIFDHSAKDKDGDSLTYELVSPYVGANQSSPRPTTPTSPPYSRCPYLFPYSVSNMMGGTVAIKINASTGELRVTPDTKGQFVVGILVKEYRDGKLIGEVLRDYQFNVEDCVFTVQANFTSPIRVCKDTIQFLDRSSSAMNYLWNFGEENSTSDTSNIPSPKWFYSKSGKYKVTLIVSNDECVDTFFNWVTVAEEEVIKAKFKVAPTVGCDKLDIKIQNESDEVPEWYWDMGDGTGKRQNQKMEEYSYTDEGAYTIKLVIVDSFKCNIRDSITRVVRVIKSPHAEFQFDTNECNGVTKFKNLSTGASGYSWDYGSPDVQNSDVVEEEVDFGKTGKYFVQLIARNGPCTDTTTKVVNVFVGYELIADGFASPLNGCMPLKVYLNSSVLPSQHNKWIMGDGNTYDDRYTFDYTYAEEGDFKLMYIAFDSASCNGSDTIHFEVQTKKKPSASFNYSYDMCTGIGAFHNESSDASSYSWDFDNGAYSNDFSPRFEFDETGIYRVRLIADSASICSDTIYRDVEVVIKDFREVKLYNAFTPNGDSYNNCFGMDDIDEDCLEVTVKVYNRWGIELFNGKGADACWDGINPSTGDPYPYGTYFALYYFKNKSTGKENTVSGTINLLE
jgi:gliding motility-associated-like protein